MATTEPATERAGRDLLGRGPLFEAVRDADQHGFQRVRLLADGERITTIMPLPEDEKTWGELDVMFASTRGTVRRNKLSDFADVRRSGIIAMKLDEGEAIVDVQICTEKDDVLLTAAGGQCIRFPVNDVRVFKGRDSTGVRGIRLEGDDYVISMAILRHVEATTEERYAYLKQAAAMRRADNAEEGEAPAAADDGEETVTGVTELTPERYAELSAFEQFVLTVSEKGYGKRTSTYEYRISGRGGKGITAMIVNERNGRLVASFPIEESDQIMLVTDGGKLIRCPVDDVRIAGRNTQGVRIFKTDEAEKVVSVERIPEDGNGVADKFLRAHHQHPTDGCSKYCVGMAALGLVSRHNRFLPAMRKLRLGQAMAVAQPLQQAAA
ncbi:MAG: hypothetical protein HC937_03110 [Aquincola sp.]|nr:hypothetical protein [Aquincola sp.]